jgi:hypothetical protein
MGTYYAPILADPFLNSHEADFIQGLLKKKESREPDAYGYVPLLVGFVLLDL